MQRAAGAWAKPFSAGGIGRILPKNPALDYQLDRLRSLLTSTGGMGFNYAVFVLLVLGAGVWSSWYFVGHGTGFNVNRVGPWMEWPSVGQPDADPYTLGRVRSFGMLPLSSRIAATFEARFDSTGQRLHSSCEYSIRSQSIKASWWSIAVYDSNGLLIPNPANRYGFDRSTIISRPDASFVISLAREARAGNWLPIAGAGRLTLVLTMVDPERPNLQTGAAAPGEEAFDLPDIQRIYCR